MPPSFFAAQNSATNKECIFSYGGIRAAIRVFFVAPKRFLVCVSGGEAQKNNKTAYLYGTCRCVSLHIPSYRTLRFANAAVCTVQEMESTRHRPLIRWPKHVNVAEKNNKRAQLKDRNYFAFKVNYTERHISNMKAFLGHMKNEFIFSGPTPYIFATV